MDPTSKSNAEAAGGGDRKVGRYWVRERLGAGGQAKVMRGEADGISYALKMFLRDGASADFHRRFASEVGALKRCQHPGVIRLVDIFDDVLLEKKRKPGVSRRWAVCVLEFVPNGRTLDPFLVRGWQARSTAAHGIQLSDERRPAPPPAVHCTLPCRRATDFPSPSPGT